MNDVARMLEAAMALVSTIVVVVYILQFTTSLMFTSRLPFMLHSGQWAAAAALLKQLPTGQTAALQLLVARSERGTLPAIGPASENQGHTALSLAATCGPRSCVAGDVMLRQQLGVPALEDCVKDAAVKAAAAGVNSGSPEEALVAVR